MAAKKTRAASPPNMTFRDVAESLGVTTRTVPQMGADGRLKA